LSPATAPVPRPGGWPTRSISNAFLWIAVFLGGFVFYEPAPYDLYLALVIPAWMIVGLKVPRAISPLIVLTVLFMAGGVLAATQAVHLDQQPMYMAITGFLVVSAWFFASIVGEDPRRLETVVSAWIIAAVLTSTLGILGYFGFTGELFLKFGRAAGGFQDPNVFGPFLAFPLVVLIRRALTGRIGAALWSSALALVIFAGLFLSFSRASWGLALFSALMMGVVLFATERRPTARARYIAVAVAGLVCLSVFIAAALSIPAVGELFQERAQIVQDYDAGHMGRFERHLVGFNAMLDHPLGIGALEFGKIYGEDEHDVWLKTLTTYGWLGFAAFFTLVLWTLIAGFPLVFRSGPMQPVAEAAYIVFLGHILIATVIDVDHWRHLFLLFGLLWGMIAADRRTAHAWTAARHSAVPAPA
jgi:hypothetical protein